MEDFDELPKMAEWHDTKITVPEGQLQISELKPNYSITFHNNTGTNGLGQKVGSFDFNGPELVFEGNPSESAKVFIEWASNAFDGRLKEERSKELKACCDLLEGMHAATDGNHNYYLHAANELRKLRGNK
jgi:hypothetical protein